MKWWQSAKSEDEDNKDKSREKDEDDEFELKPKDVKAKLDQIDGLKTSVEQLSGKSKILDRMETFLNEQDEEKQRKNEEEHRKKTESNSADLDEMFLVDPANATKKLLNDTMSPLIVSQVNTAARLTMRDLFDSNPDEFEFIHDPIIRREVEANVSKLPLASRSDPESIRNCYYVVKGRHESEIKEGKIKTKISAASGTGNGTGSVGGKSEEVVTLTPKEKRAAQVFGLKEEDYIKSKKELSYV